MGMFNILNFWFHWPKTIPDLWPCAPHISSLWYTMSLRDREQHCWSPLHQRSQGHQHPGDWRQDRCWVHRLLGWVPTGHGVGWQVEAQCIVWEALSPEKRIKLVQENVVLIVLSLEAIVIMLWISSKLQSTLFIYWSIQYWGLWHIYRCYIVNWRINKLLLPRNLYSGAKLIGATFCSNQTNTIPSSAVLHVQLLCHWLPVIPK